jgi:hypothetical protein
MSFDRFFFADYSGAVDEGAQRRGIALWRQDAGGQAHKVSGPFTRKTLREHLFEELRRAQREGARVLFGIDHQWSWPRDLWRAAKLDHLDWRDALDSLVKGDGDRPPLGAPMLFPSAFNAWAKADVFYCRVKGLAQRYGLPAQVRWEGDPVRLVERMMPGTKPATRLGGIGAVAGQTLWGLMELHRLLGECKEQDIPLLAWPFDKIHDDGLSHVGLEVYPGAFNLGIKSDDADARACCEWADEQQGSGKLHERLDLRALSPEQQRMVRCEGWILGAEVKALN